MTVKDQKEQVNDKVDDKKDTDAPKFYIGGIGPITGGPQYTDSML